MTVENWEISMLKLSFDCVNNLERVEDELELREVVVEPLRTMFVAAKEML